MFTQFTIERPKITTFFLSCSHSSIMALTLVTLEAKMVTIVLRSAFLITLSIFLRIKDSLGECAGLNALVESESKTVTPSLPYLCKRVKSVKLPIGV